MPIANRNGIQIHVYLYNVYNTYTTDFEFNTTGSLAIHPIEPVKSYIIV